MNLPEFVKEYNNKYVHWDKVHGAQCTDLVRVYIREVLLDRQPKLVSIASQIWYNYPKEYYEGIKNLPDNFPLPGNIVIWNCTYGGTGHIAIALGCTTNKLVVFSQNDPKNSKAKIREYKNYRHVLGWLQFKGN